MCTADLSIYPFSTKVCVLSLMIVFCFLSGCCSLTDSTSLCRHQRFEKAFLLAVDLEDRDLFMVSWKKISLKLPSSKNVTL